MSIFGDEAPPSPTFSLLSSSGAESPANDPPASSASESADTFRLGEYARRRRSLLDTLNSLHSTGVQNELDLPTVVVVGSQSVGKSSLIESMSGITLPRDTGTCTRCPMECRLQNAPTWSCNIILRFQYDSAGRPLADTREVQFGPTLDNKTDVEQALRRAQRAILRPTLDHSFFLDDEDLKTGGHPPQTFSSNLVCIRVAGPTVPDLYFFDLPGIIANVGDGGREADIKLVENLAKEYISRPNCIVLLVISCETDFENQGAGRLVLQSEELRQRTVGVLTKVDRIEPGAGSKWLKMLKNEENTLRNGWFCVKQPDLLELQSGISWEDAKAKEHKFFESTSPWAKLSHQHRVRLGVEGLADCLGRILSDLVSQKLPTIQAEIHRLLRDVKSELDAFPKPTYADPRKEVIMLLRDFNKTLAKHIEGLPPSPSSDQTTIRSSALIHSINMIYEKFRDKLHQTAPQFYPWPSQTALAEPLKTRLIASAREDDAPPVVGAVKTFYLDEVMDLAKKSRTRELPGNYPFCVKTNLIAESVELWRALAKECFAEVQDTVIDHIDKLIQEHFVKYAHGGLMNSVTMAARKLLRDRIRAMDEKIESLCLSEDTPFTQNDHYFFSFRSKLLARYKSIHNQALGQSNIAGTLQSHNPQSWANTGLNQYQWQYINNVITNLTSLGIHGVVAADLVKLLPDNDMSPALDIMAEVRAYFQVAYKRFGDNVPNQIDTNFVRGIDSGLDFALMYMDLSADQCLKWLQESPADVQRREELIGKRNRLEAARDKLAVTIRV